MTAPQIYAEQIRILMDGTPTIYELHERDRGRYTLRDLALGSGRLVLYQKNDPVLEMKGTLAASHSSCAGQLRGMPPRRLGASPPARSLKVVAPHPHLLSRQATGSTS